MVFLVALSVRAYLVLQHRCINPDGIQYIEMAAFLRAGAWREALAYFYPPGYPLLISLLYPPLADWELAGQIVSLIFGSLLVFPLFFLIKSMYSSKTALLAIVLLSFAPYPARLSAEVRSEAPYIFFATLALLFLHLGLKRWSFWRAGLCGISASAAYLTRPEGGGLVVIAGAALLLSGIFRRREWPVKKVVLSGVAVIIGFSLLSLPYILYLKHDTGRWMVSRKASNVFSIGLYKYDEQVGHVSQDQSSSTDVLELVADNPLLLAKKFFLELLTSVPVFAEALHLTFVPFLLIGLTRRFRRRSPADGDGVLFLFFAFYLALFSLFFANRRFFVQLTPVALAWTALGVESAAAYVAKSLKGARIPKSMAANPLAPLIVLVALVTLPKTLTPINAPHSHFKEAGLWIRANSAESAILMTNEKRVAFYAQRKWIEAPAMNEPEPVKYSAVRHIDFIALEEPADSAPASTLFHQRLQRRASCAGEKGEVVNIYTFAPSPTQQPVQVRAEETEYRHE
jgi:4-amino-4-deoxy-L-arabinose transferase-like glycosyltransferase